MDATKLTISPDTLRFQKMSRGKKTKLRRQNVIDLINSKPYGTPITLREFAAATQTLPTSVNGLIHTMVRRGIISKDEISPRKYAYRVNGPITTRKLLPPPAAPKTAAEAMPARPIIEPNRLAYVAMEQLAKEFYWETASNNLHEFVVWLGKKEEAR